MNEHKHTAICVEVRRELQDFWVERQLDRLLKKPDEAPVRVARHLLECRECQREAEALIDVERTLKDGFAEFDRQAHLPDDQIADILRRVIDEPAVPLLRRTRRSVRTILWLCLLLFGVLGCSALLALAYKVLFDL